MATGRNQVWSWDITWLKTDVKGVFLFAYVILDILSRKIVGWSIEESESPELARNLFRRIIRELGLMPIFVHADNEGADERTIAGGIPYATGSRAHIFTATGE